MEDGSHGSGRAADDGVKRGGQEGIFRSEGVDGAGATVNGGGVVDAASRCHDSSSTGEHGTSAAASPTAPASSAAAAASAPSEVPADAPRTTAAAMASQSQARSERLRANVPSEPRLPSQQQQHATATLAAAGKSGAAPNSAIHATDDGQPRHPRPQAEMEGQAASTPAPPTGASATASGMPTSATNAVAPSNAPSNTGPQHEPQSKARPQPLPSRHPSNAPADASAASAAPATGASVASGNANATVAAGSSGAPNSTTDGRPQHEKPQSQPPRPQAATEGPGAQEDRRERRQAAAAVPQAVSGNGDNGSPFPKFNPSFSELADDNGGVGNPVNRDDGPGNGKIDDDDDDDDDLFGEFNDGFDDEDAFDDWDSQDNNSSNNNRAGRPRGSDAFPNEPSPRTGNAAPASRHTILTIEDIEICQRLDEEYDRALEEREIGWTARYNSVRQSACFSLSFMLFYLIMGTMFFFRHTDWQLNDTLLFTIYTITTVGYGNHDIPNTPGVQTFIIFYIFVGIATLTIMVAQVYQCVALEATRAQYSRDKAEIARSRHERNRSSVNGNGDLELSSAPSSGHGAPGAPHPEQLGVPNSDDASSFMVDFDEANRRSRCDSPWHAVLGTFEEVKNFLRHTQLGRGVSVLLPFAGLILIGAAVVGPIEGWTFVESLYFAVVSLTTVGFGDYHPTKDSAVWFCIFWLPFSVGFMSLYLGGVAHFYIRLSNSNIERLERQMRRRIRRAKEWAEKEKRQADARLAEAASSAASRKTKRRALDEESGEVAGDGSDEGGPGGAGGAAAGAAQDQTIASAPSSPARPKQPNKRRARDYFQTLPTGDETDSEEDERGALGGAFARQAHREGVVDAGGGSTALFGSDAESREGVGSRRRRQVMSNAGLENGRTGSGGEGATDAEGLRAGKPRPRGHTMATMKDVLTTVHGHIKRNESVVVTGEGGAAKAQHESLTSIITGEESVLGPETEFMSIRSSSQSVFGREKSERKPSFALRCLVQERVAEIIATEIAGFQSHVEIKDNTLSVTIDSLKTTADKWMIPRRARKAFRAVAFEALYFVGEHGLITRGADSLYDLTPFEFHGLFGTFLAAMGDADTMEAWLDGTNVLAEVDLRRGDGTSRRLSSSAPSSRNLSERSGSDSLGGRRGGNGGGPTRRTSKQAERLSTVRERHLGGSTLGTPDHKFRTHPGNAFGK